jgi:glycosyltransferase involved in cell wall biosynthesis
VDQFGVSSNAVTIIPYGVNNAVPASDLTREEARRRIGLRSGEKGILFFGAIKRYKGLQYLVEAFEMLAGKHSDFRLIIAGERKKGSDEYLDRILSRIAGSEFRESVIQKIEFIPDEEIEVYFKAADVAVLPYTEIFQSGILFLTYNFGLPVIASDVGSFREDVIEGRTGFVCRAEDAADLAAKIEMYFESDLFRRLEEHRKSIRDFVYCEHSWDKVSEITRGAYAELIGAKEVKGSA